MFHLDGRQTTRPTRWPAIDKEVPLCAGGSTTPPPPPVGFIRDVIRVRNPAGRTTGRHPNLFAIFVWLWDFGPLGADGNLLHTMQCGRSFKERRSTRIHATYVGLSGSPHCEHNVVRRRRMNRLIVPPLNGYYYENAHLCVGPAHLFRIVKTV